MKYGNAFVIPTELLAAFMAGYLGWVGWISLTVSTLNSRIAVLEDRDGIHAEARAATPSPHYAGVGLLNIPPLLRPQSKGTQ